MTSNSNPKQSRLTSAEWKLVLILAAINVTHILDFVIVMPLGDRLREELLITPQQFGFIVSAYGVAAMVSGIIASTLVDRFDRKWTMLFSLTGFIGATFYCGFAPNYFHLLAGRIFAGGFGGIVASTVMAFVVDLIPNERRGKAIGVVSSSFAFASTVGLPLGLLIADGYDDFHVAFQAIGWLGVLVLLVSAFSLPSVAGHSDATQGNPFRQFLYVAKNSNHLWSFAFTITMVWGTFMIVPFIAPYLIANCELPRAHLPILYLVGGLCTLVTVNFVGWLTDRVGPLIMFLFTAGGSIVFAVLITNLPPVNSFVSIGVSVGFMMVASSRIVPGQAMMLKIADPKARGAFTSLNSAFMHLATGTAPLLSGLLIGEEYPKGPLTGYPFVGLIAAIFGVVAIGFAFLLNTRTPTQNF
ncbi:MAG: MFS transporter [Pirellulaceae bacterium]